ncbi:uncharacterized protein LOC128860868 [Anastrepha ludens]|uniref:uncharacterized protein LOC128860868 n=1 Tax=Anastrepha ludens TaxID=28586 RepID=UPI0023AEA307|nr:uncharacterized protein LOC128860868 [Anastrepha ludens]
MSAIHGEHSPELDINASIDINGNTEELEGALIRYITTSSRFLFVEREETWNDFLLASRDNSEKFGEYTTEQLCDRFQQKVLPNIYNYELTQQQKQLLDLLKLHPEYERTANGYIRMSVDRRIGYERRPKEGESFLMVSRTHQLRQLINESTLTITEMEANKEFDLTKPRLSPTHTLLLRVPYERQGTGYNYQFSKQNAALISAALSNDFELFGRMLIEPRELHRRLRIAKRDFEQYGRIPENCLDADKLLAKIRKLKTLREAIVNVFSSRF